MSDGDIAGGGASFVKRRKPKVAATRLSSTYDEPEPQSPMPGSSSRPTAAHDGSRDSTPRQLLSRGGSDEEPEADLGGVVFRSRAKGARSTPTSTTGSSSRAQTQRDRINDEEKQSEEDGVDGPAIEVRRKTRRPGAAMSALSSSSAAAPRRSTPLRPTAFKDMTAHAQDDAEAANGSQSLYTSKYLEELRTSTPTARSRLHSPSPSLPGPGTLMDDPMTAPSSRPGFAHVEDDDALARSKFAADFEHDAIPSESVIRAAKEKRAKLRAAAATAASAASSTDAASEDFISLAPFSRPSAVQAYSAMEVDTDPHPHSRLQREEDEFGDGEDEFAEFTGATERLPIGEKAEQEYEQRQRRQMEAAVRGDFDEDATPGGVVEEMDEDEEEWERSQLRRTQPSSGAGRSREPSPYPVAPIPDAVPVPTVGTCSTRLQLTLRALEQSVAAAEAVMVSTSRELEMLDAAEAENKLDVTAVEDKASWFGELDAFVVSLARFMAEKGAKVDEVEAEAVGVLARRAAMLARARGRWMDSLWTTAFELAPSTSLVTIESDGDDDGEAGDVGSLGGDEAECALRLEELTPADQMSLDLAQREILDRLEAVFADVQAREYLDPIAMVDTSGSDGFSSGHSLLRGAAVVDWATLHPRSVVARFEEWRRRYPDEYAQVWGGLSVGQIWEFYARLELVPWDGFRRCSRAGWTAGGEAVAHLRWFAGASEYTERATRRGQDAVGGDDEVLATLVANVLVPKLLALLERGVFCVWSESEVAQLVQMLDVVQTVLGETHARFVSLLDKVMGVYATQIQRLQEVVSGLQAGRAEGWAAEQLLHHLLRLLRNIVLLESVIKPSSSADSAIVVMRTRLVHLVEQLTVQVVQPILTHLSRSPATLPLASNLRQSLISTLPPSITAHSSTLASLAS